jgi:hypothetical protein
MTAQDEQKLREMTRDLVQKPRDPLNPGLVEAKQYITFNDALRALHTAFNLGQEHMSGERERP